MDKYQSEWKKSFLNWKKMITIQYKAIMYTFDTRAIQRFLENIAEKDFDENCDEELNFYAQTLRVAGSKQYSQLDEISRGLIRFYKETQGIF